MTIAKKGVLLINIGTPAAPTTKAVRAYLKEFLSDPSVIDLPSPVRYLLLRGAILPFRASKSAKAYQKIWQPGGSPLMLHTLSLKQKLQQALGTGYVVEIAMRYGLPSIENSIQKLLANCNDISFLPMFPQYSIATTGSARKKIEQFLQNNNLSLPVRWIESFYTENWYIAALAKSILPYWQQQKADALLLSYHGLPERQLDKAGAGCVNCDRLNACPSINSTNKICYRAQCYATSLAVVARLQIPKENYYVAFQSRLGRISWIKPYTDELLETLYNKGIRRLAVACPAFVADCLETIEEIGIRAKQQWLALGGEELFLIPCLNDQQVWVEALSEMLSTKNA